MALAITHTKVATFADEPGAEINKAEWNDTHTISGSVAWGELTGTVSNQTDLQTALDAKQPLNAALTDISGLAVTDGNFIVADGTNWVAESAGTARTSIGLGTGNSVQFANLTLSNGGAVRTNTGAGNTLLLQARDVDGAAYTTFMTFTANNTPTATMSGITADTAFNPTSSDGAALGTTTLMWSDLFLASGGVINFNNGNVTLTHAAGSLTSNVPLTANSFIPTSSTAPTNGMYLVAANTLGWSVNSAAEMRLTSTALSPNANDGNALGTTALMWADLFLASGAVINFNNGDVTVTHSSDTLAFAGGTNYTFDNEVNTAITSTFAGTTASIDAAALLGQDIVTWTPASTPTAAFVTSRMRKTIANATSASITGVSHPIGGYDWLVVNTGANTLDLAFVHEAKYTKSGAGTNTAVSFYKPALDTVTGTVSTITLFDGDMDLTGITYTNAYLMNNANRSYLKFNTVGQIIGATGNEVPTTLNPGITTGRYYFSAEWGSASSAAVTKDLLIACPPIIIPARTTFTRIGVRVVTGVASSAVRFGIYKMENGVPTTKIYGSASATATTANNTDVEDTISVTLEAGAYFLAYQNTGGATGATVKTLNFTDSYIMQIYGNGSSQPDAASVEDWLYVSNTGALPTSFGAVTRTRVGGALPAVYLKA
jgi:hypothetical protein